MQAPWGDLTEAVELAVRLKPEIVVPIHDWHWKDEVRTGIYSRVEAYLKSQQITFIPLQTGVSVEI
jgi:L-ascorbate metabolism protein UlaG (beta-lactamase superfamily)